MHYYKYTAESTTTEEVWQCDDIHNLYRIALYTLRNDGSGMEMIDIVRRDGSMVCSLRRYDSGNIYLFATGTDQLTHKLLVGHGQAASWYKDMRAKAAKLYSAAQYGRACHD